MTGGGGAAIVTTDVTYRGNVSDPGDNLTETITTNSTAGGGTLVNSFAYSYDANKNKLKETIGGPLNPYGFGTTVGQEATYDGEDRLTNWHRDDTLRDLNYALSKVGDWNTFSIEGVTETRTHGSAHELTNLAGGGNPGALTHDAKGNITTNPAHGSQTYVWDFDNQLKQAVSGGTHKYYYDALGRRVMKHVAGENRLIFVHDGPQIIAEYKYTNGVIGIPGGIDAGTSTTSQATQTTQTQDSAVVIGTRRGSATIQRKYVYSTYIDERCVMIDRTTKGALPAGTEELFYYHRNNLYSTAAMTDAAGLVQERYAYDAYGNILQFGADTGGGALGTPITVSALGQPYTYTGRRLDDETENYHARYYQAPLGRFLGRDRILYGDGYNMYAYVGGSPLVRLDPTGFASVVSTMAPCEDCTGNRCYWDNKIAIADGHVNITFIKDIVDTDGKQVKDAKCHVDRAFASFRGGAKQMFFAITYKDDSASGNIAADLSKVWQNLAKYGAKVGPNVITTKRGVRDGIRVPLKHPKTGSEIKSLVFRERLTLTCNGKATIWCFRLEYKGGSTNAWEKVVDRGTDCMSIHPEPDTKKGKPNKSPIQKG